MDILNGPILDGTRNNRGVDTGEHGVCFLLSPGFPRKTLPPFPTVINLSQQQKGKTRISGANGPIRHHLAQNSPMLQPRAPKLGFERYRAVSAVPRAGST